MGRCQASASPPPILPTLAKLEQIVAVLSQPRQIEAVSRRVKLLLADLDKAAQTSAAAAKRGQAAGATAETPSILSTSEKDKIDALFSLLPRIDPILPIVSPLLVRLRSLARLHASAAGFDATLRRLEAQMDGMDGSEVEEVMKRVEEGLKQQGEAVRSNWKNLDERLADVERRFRDLQK
jgi:nuclear migration protein JNM1